jgi:hypothetical protein
MFIKEKGQITKYEMNMFSSSGDDKVSLICITFFCAPGNLCITLMIDLDSFLCCATQNHPMLKPFVTNLHCKPIWLIFILMIMLFEICYITYSNALCK